jgi:hypothetical protein
VKVANLETILLEQDIAERADLYCLSCRRRLAGVMLADRFAENGDPEVVLSISLLSEDLRDFQQERGSVSLTCGCSIRSTFYLLS